MPIMFFPGSSGTPRGLQGIPRGRVVRLVEHPTRRYGRLEYHGIFGGGGGREGAHGTPWAPMSSPVGIQSKSR